MGVCTTYRIGITRSLEIFPAWLPESHSKTDCYPRPRSTLLMLTVMLKASQYGDIYFKYTWIRQSLYKSLFFINWKILLVILYIGLWHISMLMSLNLYWKPGLNHTYNLLQIHIKKNKRSSQSEYTLDKLNYFLSW